MFRRHVLRTDSRRHTLAAAVAARHSVAPRDRSRPRCRGFAPSSSHVQRSWFECVDRTYAVRASREHASRAVRAIRLRRERESTDAWPCPALLSAEPRSTACEGRSMQVHQTQPLTHEKNQAQSRGPAGSIVRPYTLWRVRGTGHGARSGRQRHGDVQLRRREHLRARLHRRRRLRHNRGKWGHLR